jgi:hypothetical protein
MLGALGAARGEWLAAGAEWSPHSQRAALVQEVQAARRVARGNRRHHEPANPALTPALGLAYPGGDLYPWLRRRGRATEVIIPAREQRLAMAVLGIPGSGKTYTLLRRVWIAARAGMRVVFVDCKGTDPGLAWQATCAYRLANPGAVVGYWPAQTLDCWRGDGMAIANRLLAVEDWAAEGGGLYYRRMGTLAIQLACTSPSGPPRSSGDFLRRLDLRKLQQLWRGDATAQADLEQLASDPTVMAGLRGRYSAFFRALHGNADGTWGLEDVDLAVLTIPTIASRTDADAAVRLVLEDLGHFATRRKARTGDDVLLVLDEFSAVQGRHRASHPPRRAPPRRGRPGRLRRPVPRGPRRRAPAAAAAAHHRRRPGAAPAGRRPRRWCSSPAPSGCRNRPGSWTRGGQPGRPACR